jgi:type IV secretory pathway TraG/TraD family ATPase VirD4
VNGIAAVFKRHVTAVGVGKTECNLLAGLTPEVVALILKSAFILGNPKADRFWLNTASEFCRNCCGILAILPGRYTLKGMYDHMFDDEIKAQNRAEAEAKLLTLPRDEQLKLERYLGYEAKIWAKVDDKIRSGIIISCAELFSPFSHPELEAAFSAPEGNEIDWSDALNGRVFLLQLPLSQWGIGGKVIYTFLKLTFFNMMQQRNQRPEWNQDKPVVLLCDEYQEIISASPDGLSDINFWDKSRSSKMIGIISAQSITSFHAVLGDHDLTNAILQNFRQKLCFRVEDMATLSYFQTLIGHADVIHESYTHGRTEPDKWDQSGSSSHSTQRTTQQRAVIDGQLMRQLRPRQALAVLSINGHGADDVLITQPLYVNNEQIIWPQ